MLLQNVWFLEKLAHFDREVIPERRMHAKGSGAFGKFTVTHDITAYTKAAIFSQIGKETELFVRFSTVAGERGVADAERDIRGFAIKFYTEEGNWDLVGNNTPVFFLRDPLKFPDLNHAVKRDPRTNMRSARNNWDFWTLLPEALHQVTITMSDRGIPASYRHMHGYGSHTFSLINAEGKRTWVKFHLHTQQGIKNLTDAEAEAIIAKDRESHQRDLYESIEKGDFPKWTMYIQVMTEEQGPAGAGRPGVPVLRSCPRGRCVPASRSAAGCWRCAARSSGHVRCRRARPRACRGGRLRPSAPRSASGMQRGASRGCRPGSPAPRTMRLSCGGNCSVCSPGRLRRAGGTWAAGAAATACRSPRCGDRGAACRRCGRGLRSASRAVRGCRRPSRGRPSGCRCGYPPAPSQRSAAWGGCRSRRPGRGGGCCRTRYGPIARRLRSVRPRRRGGTCRRSSRVSARAP